MRTSFQFQFSFFHFQYVPATTVKMWTYIKKKKTLYTCKSTKNSYYIILHDVVTGDMGNHVLVWTHSFNLFREQKLSLCTHLILQVSILFLFLLLLLSGSVKVLKTVLVDLRQRGGLSWTSCQFIARHIYCILQNYSPTFHFLYPLFPRIRGHWGLLEPFTAVIGQRHGRIIILIFSSLNMANLKRVHVISPDLCYRLVFCSSGF